MGVLLGGEEAEVRRQSNDVIRLETELAEIITPSDERRDEEAIYHKMTLAELQEAAPLVRPRHGRTSLFWGRGRGGVHVQTDTAAGH